METQSPLIQFQSRDHEEILNVVDQLRSEGVGRYISLPQIIVCGDQSSGKSSVLEAISGLEFPSKENICTRFATELILRRAPEEAVNISIYPDEQRSDIEREELRKYEPPNITLDKFADIVAHAATFIGVGRGGHPYSKDVLRVEVSGPAQPHLTMVDLPGLYHASDETQDERGVSYVESLVWSYMQQERSVILAVISAKSDIALQKVSTLYKRIDRHGNRTMGIITKPDTLSVDSEMEKAFIDLALNKRAPLRLDWHVLKNRSYEQRHFTSAQRHQSESKFLSSGPWANLPRTKVGIDSLRQRLSNVLKDHIVFQLPGLTAEAQASVTNTQTQLRALGVARQTLTEQRRYLLEGSERFSSLLTDAVHGLYHEAFFGDPVIDQGYEKRLRAVVQNRLTDFSATVASEGAARIVIADNKNQLKSLGGRNIFRADYLEEVRLRMRRSRGRELPGTFNPLIIGELFYLQAKPWESIATRFIEQLLEDVHKTIMPILREVLDIDSCEGVLRHVIDPALEKIEQLLRTKTKELLKPQQSGHPITYNHYFTESVQEARAQHLRKSNTDKLEKFFGNRYAAHPNDQTGRVFMMAALVDALSLNGIADMETFACSEAADCAEAYYNVAMKKFVDDFSNLAVETCLLEPLRVVFGPRTVDSLPERVVHDIAAENQKSKTERGRLEDKLSKMQIALKSLHRLERHGIKAQSHDLTDISSIDSPAISDVEGDAGITLSIRNARRTHGSSSLATPPSVIVDEEFFEGLQDEIVDGTERLEEFGVKEEDDTWASFGVAKKKKKSSKRC